MRRAMNFIDGQWVELEGRQYLRVFNPAPAQPLGGARWWWVGGGDGAAEAAARAFQDWRRTPAVERVQYLFRLKNLLEDHFEELARSITLENGKILEESRGELRRAA